MHCTWVTEDDRNGWAVQAYDNPFVFILYILFAFSEQTYSKLGGHFGTDVRPDISNHISFVYMDSEIWDLIIDLPFKITTYTYTSMGHRIGSRK